ncbi:MAG: ribokinase [Bacteroidales bacterium]|jgi:ribokinase
MRKIIVIGSSNTDMVVKCKKLPTPGETILGGAFLMNPGGKGANQAVAAARLNGIVTFVTKTGNDHFGEQSKLLFEKEGIDTRFLIRDQKNPSGVALIAVDENGENTIVVASGSNATLSAYDIDEEVYVADKEDVYLMQLEIPVGTVEYVAQKVSDKGNRVILNPAPARLLSQELLDSVYVLTPNEIEAEILTGIKVENASSAERSAMKLLDKGVKNVIITMGAAGAYLCTPEISKMIPVVPVKAVDTTAAGDVFNGALAVALAEGKDLEEAVGFANKAASISVTRLGAQASAPYRNELD